MAMPIWITEAGVVGTWGAVVVALFGERIRVLLFKPALQIRLLSNRGEFVHQTIVPNNQITQQLEARYYHIQLTNRRRTTKASDAQVIITSIEAVGSNGRPQVVYTGMLPLQWRHGELHPRTRTVGPPADADLLFARQDGIVSFLPMLFPNNFPGQYQAATHLWVTLQARSTEGDSAPLRLEIDWDGQWDRDEAQMATHLRFTASGG